MRDPACCVHGASYWGQTGVKSPNLNSKYARDSGFAARLSLHLLNTKPAPECRFDPYRDPYRVPVWVSSLSITRAASR
jgi:hypothetical protein